MSTDKPLSDLDKHIARVFWWSGVIMEALERIGGDETHPAFVELCAKVRERIAVDESESE